MTNVLLEHVPNAAIINSLGAAQLRLVAPSALVPSFSLAGRGHRLACLPIALPNYSFRAEWSKLLGGQARVSNAESNNSSNPWTLIRSYPIAPSNPSSVYIPMSVTDSYTQSQTRLHNSVTALDTATAHWRRNAANAHLAAVVYVDVFILC